MADKLEEKALLIHVSISTWDGKVRDKRLGEALQEKFGINTNSVDARKYLFPKEKLKAIKKIEGYSRNKVVYKYCLPWDKNGWWILPVSNYEKFMHDILSYKAQFEHELEIAARNYESFIDAARILLAGLFEQSDYPSPEDFRDRFNYKISRKPIPSADLRLENLPENVIEEIKKENEAQIMEQFEGAIQHVWENIVGVLQKIRDNCQNYETNGKVTGKLHKTMITHVQEIVEMLPAMNLTNDPIMDQIGKELKDSFSNIQIKDLKEDAMIRSDAVDKAEKLLDKMKGLF